MEQINQTIRQKEVSVEHILETQYELVTTTNAVRTDLDYRQYRFHESISQLISELGEIKRNIVSVPITNINIESNHQDSEIDNEVIILNQIDPIEECFVCGKGYKMFEG